MAPIPNPKPPPPAEGRPAIAAAERAARSRSRAGNFVGGLQLFAYAPGRVYEVWTAPLRVTTLTLSPGETVVAKAAGDTVRWQIGETRSGDGEAQRTQVLVKPLKTGLETNLVLATNRRIYLIALRSGEAEAFNAQVAWDAAATRRAPPSTPPAPPPPPPPPRPASPAQPAKLDGRYDIDPKGRPPRWTPTAVFADGRRTYIVFPRTLSADEAPALFALGPDGGRQMVNYRQQDGLWVADRVLARAELRLGAKRAQAVRITRKAEAGR
jgi:type IV secretion system protein VirB9